MKQVLLAMLLVACKPVKEPLNEKQRVKLSRQIAYTIKKYGQNQIKGDFATTQNEYYTRYVNGRLVEAGKKVGDQRKGVWFFFDDSLRVIYLISYNKKSQDTIAHLGLLLIKNGNPAYRSLNQAT